MGTGTDTGAPLSSGDKESFTGDRRSSSLPEDFLFSSPASFLCSINDEWASFKVLRARLRPAPYSMVTARGRLQALRGCAALHSHIAGCFRTCVCAVLARPAGRGDDDATSDAVDGKAAAFRCAVNGDDGATETSRTGRESEPRGVVALPVVRARSALPQLIRPGGAADSSRSITSRIGNDFLTFVNRPAP